jgi:histidinol-phosphate phosphatase family protein
MKSRRSDQAVFIDKDGVLIHNHPFNIDPSEMRLMPGTAEGLLMLARQGYRLFAFSNEPGVALGFFSEVALKMVEARLKQLVEEAGARLESFYYCPHSTRGNLLKYTRGCDCHLPAPGLFERAARDHGLSLERSWLLGDSLDDVEAGRRAGCRTLLVDNGGESEWHFNEERRPHRVASDLFESAALVIGSETSKAERQVRH